MSPRSIWTAISTKPFINWEGSLNLFVSWRQTCQKTLDKLFFQARSCTPACAWLRLDLEGYITFGYGVRSVTRICWGHIRTVLSDCFKNRAHLTVSWCGRWITRRLLLLLTEVLLLILLVGGVLKAPGGAAQRRCCPGCWSRCRRRASPGSAPSQLPELYGVERGLHRYVLMSSLDLHSALSSLNK